MKFVIILLCAISEVICQESWGVVGNPLLHAYPCENETDIMVSFEPGLPPGEENQYSVHIAKQLPIQTQINMKFDTEATVTLSNPSVARIRTFQNDNSFNIRFFKPAKSIGFIVKGPATGIIPYFESLNINTVEYCKKPMKGYLDEYIQGIQPVAETHFQMPDDSCGRRKIGHTELIVNGAETKPGDWPWHAAIYKLDRATIRYICGGTLLSNTFVLTAAHCTTVRGEPVIPEILNVVLGKYNLAGGDTGVQEKEIHEIIVHDKFTHRNLDFDISLIKLKTVVTFGDYIQPACLWYPKALQKLPNAHHIIGTVIGWGFDQNDVLSTQLRQATMPKVSEATCIKSNPVFYSNILNNKKFCAGLKNGTSACNGDSGGAFLVFVPDITGDDSPNAPGAWYIYGIVSLSVSRRDVPLCDPNHYVVFTDVTKFISWIEKYVK